MFYRQAIILVVAAVFVSDQGLAQKAPSIPGMPDLSNIPGLPAGT